MPLFTPSSSPVPHNYLLCFHIDQITIKLSQWHEDCKKTHLQASHLIASSENTEFSCFSLDLHCLQSRDTIACCLLDIQKLEIEIFVKENEARLGVQVYKYKVQFVAGEAMKAYVGLEVQLHRFLMSATGIHSVRDLVDPTANLNAMNREKTVILAWNRTKFPQSSKPQPYDGIIYMHI